MLNAQKVTANSSFFLSALVIQKVLSFVYFTILARGLGVELTGRYFFAISFATMFAVLMDLGLAPVLTREVARQSGNEQKWFQQIFSLKLLLTFLSILILLSLNFFLFSGDPVQALLYLTTLIVAIDSFTLLFYAYIRGQQNLKFEALGTIIFQLIVMLLGLTLLFFTKNLVLIISVLFFASLFNLIFSGIVLNLKFKTKLNLLWQKDLLQKIFLITWPFALSAIFAKIYAYLDTFLLKMFLGDSAVGFYSVAYKITFAWQFIPLGLVAALYPAFSHFFLHDKTELNKVFNKGFLYLALVALPILSGIIVLAPEIILKVYKPEFAAAILPLQILIASLAFLFMNFALSSLLNSANLQKTNTRNLALTMFFNLLANLFLIPFLGVLGAALASSFSTLVLFSLNLKAALKIVKIHHQALRNIFLALIASILMAALVYFSKMIIWWPLTILLGVVFYASFLLASKILTWQEIKYWRRSIFKKD